MEQQQDRNNSLKDLEDKIAQLRKEFDKLLFKEGNYESCKMIFRKIKKLESLKVARSNETTIT